MFSYATKCEGCKRDVIGKGPHCYRCATQGPPKPVVMAGGTTTLLWTNNGFTNASMWPVFTYTTE